MEVKDTDSILFPTMCRPDGLPCMGVAGGICNGLARVSDASRIRNGPTSGRTHTPDVQALDIYWSKGIERVYQRRLGCLGPVHKFRLVYMSN